VPLHIKLTSGSADDLLDYLRQLGADARRSGPDDILVVRRHARVPGEPEVQDRMEMEFIVRWWARNRPGAAFRIDEAA
jgi:hypothetical protein